MSDTTIPPRAMATLPRRVPWACSGCGRHIVDADVGILIDPPGSNVLLCPSCIDRAAALLEASRAGEEGKPWRCWWVTEADYHEGAKAAEGGGDG